MRDVNLCLLHQSESTCAKAFSKFQCEDASGIRDNSLLFYTECDADIRKNLYTNFMPSSGTAMFQGAVERMTKEPTVLAPFTMSVFGIFCLMWTSHCAASPCYSERHQKKKKTGKVALFHSIFPRVLEIAQPSFCSLFLLCELTEKALWHANVLL